MARRKEGITLLIADAGTDTVEMRRDGWCILAGSGRRKWRARRGRRRMYARAILLYDQPA
jgi:hypothetical protein